MKATYGKPAVTSPRDQPRKSFWDRSGATGSPNRSIRRTFQAIFEMPAAPFNHNLFKISKRRYRNPISLAREWRKAIDEDKYACPAALARQLRVSRARVTQVLNLLKLAPEVIDIISLVGDPLKSPCISERKLRPLLCLAPEEQAKQIRILLSGKAKRI